MNWFNDCSNLSVLIELLMRELLVSPHHHKRKYWLLSGLEIAFLIWSSKATNIAIGDRFDCRVEWRDSRVLISNELDPDYIEQWAARLGLRSPWKEMLDNIS